AHGPGDEVRELEHAIAGEGGHVARGYHAVSDHGHATLIASRRRARASKMPSATTCAPARHAGGVGVSTTIVAPVLSEMRKLYERSPFFEKCVRARPKVPVSVRRLPSRLLRSLVMAEGSRATSAPAPAGNALASTSASARIARLAVTSRSPSSPSGAKCARRSPG